MADNNFTTTTVGWMAITTAATAVLALVFIGLMAAVHPFFGTLNDIFNGLLGILLAVLAWMLYAEHHAKTPPGSQIALILAVVGAVIAVIGSVLVIFKYTGWVLAGFYTSIGDAIIGLWLAMFCYAMLRNTAFPHNLMTFGLVTGILMAVGLISVLGITTGIDSIESLPWYLNVGYLGYVGTYILYPIWAIWLGRVLLSRG